MGVAVKNVQADRRTGQLTFRKVIPAPLRPFFPGNRSEFKRSLGTKRLGADAMRKAEEAEAEYERLISKAAKAASGTFDHLDTVRIDWLAGAYVHAWLKQDEESRFDPDDSRFELPWRPSFRAAPMGFMDGATRREKALSGLPLVLVDLCDAYGSGDPQRVVQLEGENAVELLDLHGLRGDTASPEFATLCQKLLVADMALVRSLLARFEGEPVPTPEGPAPFPDEPEAERSSPRKTRQEETFEAIAQRLMETPALGITNYSREAWRTALRYLGEAHGTLTPAQLERRHATELRDLLFAAPKSGAMPKKERSLPLRERVERYVGTAHPRLNGKTVQEAIRALSSIWKKGQDEGLIGQNLSNPFKAVNVAREAPPENPQEFSREELQTILALPVFTEGAYFSGNIGAASYWIPLLLMFTGARPEEIAQLTLSDVTKGEGGRLVLAITDAGEEHPTKGRKSLKTRKTRTGIRRFPVPLALTRLGFGEYVQHLKDTGQRALFPGLRTKGTRGLHAYFSNRWSEYLKMHHAFPAGEGRRALREFRQLWASEAIACKLSDEERKYLMGHAADTRTASSHYGNLSPLGLAIDRVSFDWLDLSHVKPWEPHV